MGPPNQPLHSDALPFGRLWYGEPSAISNAIDNAKFRSRSHGAVIRVYDAAGNVIETQGHIGDVKVCHRRFLHTLVCAKATRAKVVALSISGGLCRD